MEQDREKGITKFHLMWSHTTLGEIFRLTYASRGPLGASTNDQSKTLHTTSTIKIKFTQFSSKLQTYDNINI